MEWEKRGGEDEEEKSREESASRLKNETRPNVYSINDPVRHYNLTYSLYRNFSTEYTRGIKIKNKSKKFLNKIPYFHRDHLRESTMFLLSLSMMKRVHYFRNRKRVRPNLALYQARLLKIAKRRVNMN